MFLDTSGLLCYHHKDEDQHDAARVFVSAASGLVTHNYVIAEFVALANARRLPRQPVLAFVEELTSNSLIEVVWVDRLIHAAGFALLRTQLDKSYSLCDAISFLLMSDRGITEALTTDVHFEQAGLVRLLK